MSPALLRLAAALVLAALAACTTGPVPVGSSAPNSADVNPITGSRGGTNGR